MCNNARANIDCYSCDQRQQQAAPLLESCVYTTLLLKNQEESLDDKIFVILNVCQKLLRYV